MPHTVSNARRSRDLGEGDTEDITAIVLHYLGLVLAPVGLEHLLVDILLLLLAAATTATVIINRNRSVLPGKLSLLH